MHNVFVVHLVGHNGRRSDDSNILSHQIYQKVFSLLLVLASDHANVDVRILYTPNHHQVLESMSDSHQEQEQLLYSYQCKYQEF